MTLTRLLQNPAIQCVAWLTVLYVGICATLIARRYLRRAGGMVIANPDDARMLLVAGVIVGIVASARLLLVFLRLLAG